MNTLREALDFISDFVPLSSINYPLLKVGLERENIEQQVSVLPFKLSEEVLYDLTLV